MLRTCGIGSDSESAVPLVATPPAQPTANILDIETDDLAILIGLISVAMASFSAENDLNSFPLREISLLSPCSIQTSDRKPSHLISKNQSGRLNGRGLRPSGIVWKCGRGTEISIANPVLAAQAPAVAPRDSMN